MAHQLLNLKRLRGLWLANAPVRDEHLASLAEHTHLKTIDLRGTRVTPAAVDRLRKAIPKTEILDNRMSF